MPTNQTWPGGATDASPTAYSIPSSGELNWATLSDFLNALATSAQSTTAQKVAIRKATSSPVTVSATADCVVVTDLTVAGAVTVNLPAGANKQVFWVVDGKGDAGTNTITINRNGTNTIQGGTSTTIDTNREAVMLVYNSADTDWKIVMRCRITVYSKSTSGPAYIRVESTDTASASVLQFGDGMNQSIIEHINSAFPTVARRNNLEVFNQTATGSITLHTNNDASPRVTINSTGTVFVHALTTNGPVYTSGATGQLNSEAQLAITRGGTAGATATAGFDNLAPTTTRGDLITRDASNNVRLPISAANLVLRSNGTDPSWAQVALATDVSGQLPTANGGTGQNSTATFPTSGTVMTREATETVTGVKTFSNGIIFANETLSTYDEGTWSATVKVGLTNVTPSTQVCRYTRIGNMVRIQAYIDFAKSGTGNVSVTGLPFNSSNISAQFQNNVFVAWNSGYTQAAGVTQTYGHIGNNSADISLLTQSSTGGANGNVTDGTLAASAILLISGTYQTG